MLYKKLDFIKVLKHLAKKSLEEKWYGIELDWRAMTSDCAFCKLMKKQKTWSCFDCVLEQFINKKKIDICTYIAYHAVPDSTPEKLIKIKMKVIGWLEQIAENGGFGEKERAL